MYNLCILLATIHTNPSSFIHRPQVLVTLPASCLLLVLAFKAVVVIKQKMRFLPLFMILVFLNVSARMYDTLYREEKIVSWGVHWTIFVLIMILMTYLPIDLNDPSNGGAQKNGDSKKGDSTWMTEFAWMTDPVYFIAMVWYDITVIGLVDFFTNTNSARDIFLKLDDTRNLPEFIFEKPLRTIATAGLFCCIYFLKMDTNWGLDLNTFITLGCTITCANNIYFPAHWWKWIEATLLVFIPCTLIIAALPNWEMKALAVTAVLCLTYRHYVKACENADEDKARDSIALILGGFFLLSNFVFIFLIFLTSLVTLINSASAILLVPDHQLFPQVMKMAMFCAIFTFMCCLPQFFDFAVHSFNNDAKWYQFMVVDLYNKLSFNGSSLTSTNTRLYIKEITASAEKMEEWKEWKYDPKSVYKRFQRLPFFVGIIVMSFFWIRGIYHVQELNIVESQTGSDYQYNEKDNSFNLQGLILHRHKDNNDSVIQRDESHSYSACSMRWRNLTAFDYALLASIAYYYPDPSRAHYQNELAGMKAALDFSFPKNLYNVELVEDWDSSPRNKQENGTFKKFFKFDFHDQKHTVIAVQGTANLHDGLADLRLCAVSAMIDFAEFFLFPLNFVVDRNRRFMQMVMDLLQSYVTIDEGKVCV